MFLSCNPQLVPKQTREKQICLQPQNLPGARHPRGFGGRMRIKPPERAGGGGRVEDRRHGSCKGSWDTASSQAERHPTPPGQAWPPVKPHINTNCIRQKRVSAGDSTVTCHERPGPAGQRADNTPHTQPSTWISQSRPRSGRWLHLFALLNVIESLNVYRFSHKV